MIMYFGALRQSMLRRLHVATWRPREAGGLDAAADRLLPTIGARRENATVLGTASASGTTHDTGTSRAG
jgi:hypothetical protein